MVLNIFLLSCSLDESIASALEGLRWLHNYSAEKHWMDAQLFHMKTFNGCSIIPCVKASATCTVIPNAQALDVCSIIPKVNALDHDSNFLCLTSAYSTCRDMIC